MRKMTKSFLTKLFNHDGEELCGKQYNYLLKRKNKGYKLYRRIYDGDEWELYALIKYGDELEQKKWKMFKCTMSDVTAKGQLGEKA